MAKDAVMAAEVFFDYTCGYSNRARHWLDELDDVQVTWRPFSLLEQNRHGGLPVFDQPELGDNVSLIVLAVHGAVPADGGGWLPAPDVHRLARGDRPAEH